MNKINELMTALWEHKKSIIVGVAIGIILANLVG